MKRAWLLVATALIALLVFRSGIACFEGDEPAPAGRLTDPGAPGSQCVEPWPDDPPTIRDFGGPGPTRC